MKNPLFICFLIIFFCVIFLGVKLESQKAEIETLKTELNECRQTSFERFEIARQLSDICDKFQSSRNEKYKFICQKK